ncbi:MAG: M2 family metallopeptidase [Lentimicrobiaceae bacterium]|nr:M2 family metallopeptidase [Lentimicrobiaceae bacterium]MCO5266288.1 M2 family metallopeptidase [Lentimicrobium sp.]HPG32633.1 M2 family metallopeptidase [Lentimicrobium sp.]
MKRTLNLLLPLLSLLLIAGGCSNKKEKMEQELKQFIADWEARVEPLQRDAYIAYWNASISGNDEDYAKSEQLQFQLNSIYTSKEDFALLKKIKESEAVTDTMLKRQLDVLYTAYLSNQIDTTLLAKRIKMEVEIEKKYSNFRADVNGRQLSDNDVEELLKTSTNSAELQSAWEGHKKIGQVVSADIIALVKVRNQIAQELGFKNYHAMSLELSEQNPDDISSLFDELDNLTRDAFAGLKDEIDTYLANRLKINKDQLMPWHYQNRFFQEAPSIYSVDLDKYYGNQNIEELTTNYYSSIGLDITDMLANSDLYEKPGKNQHAYCIDIDNAGDVRILCNIKPNYSWMNTMMHEFGHGVYDKYIDRNLPFSLRNPAHTFTTEAIAMMFGRMGSNPQWMQDMGLIDSTEKVRIAQDTYRVLRLEQLTFSRWAQVMYRFEKSMYENPDQDLNDLWWSLVEKYQMIKRPEGRNEPDWASKIHIATSPCYYHNYLLGELLASQLNHYITANIVKSDDFRYQSFYGNKEVGKYLTQKVFMPGASLYWNDMIEKATGEKLTARYYAEQFVK